MAAGGYVIVANGDHRRSGAENGTTVHEPARCAGAAKGTEYVAEILEAGARDEQAARGYTEDSNKVLVS